MTNATYKDPFFIVDEHPTTFSEILDPRGMHGFKISNYPVSRVDERIQENKIPFKGFCDTLHFS